MIYVIGLIILIALFLPSYKGLRFYYSTNIAFLSGMLIFYVVSYFRELILSPEVFTHEYDQIHVEIQVLILVSLLFYLASYFVMHIQYISKGAGKGNYNRNNCITKKMATPHIYIAIIITSLVFILKSQDWLPLFLSNYIGIIQLFPTVYLYYHLSKATFVSRYQYLLFLILFVILLFGVSRFNALYLVIPLFLYEYYLHSKKIKIWYLIAIIFTVILIGSFSKTVAILGQYNIEGSFLTSPVFYSQLAMRTITVDFLDTYRNLISIIELYSHDSSLLLGESLITPVINFIPRFIWEDKPLSFGFILGDTLYPDTGISLAPSFIGELYANLGIIGVAMGSLFLGAISNNIDYKLSNNSAKPYPEGIFLVFIFFMLPRGDFLQLSVLLYSYLPLKLLYSLKKR